MALVALLLLGATALLPQVRQLLFLPRTFLTLFLQCLVQLCLVPPTLPLPGASS